MAFAENYVDVATRIVKFRERYPDGSLQPINPAKPIEIVTVGDKTFLQYVAAAYRTPQDERPGIGVAWEPFPGTTAYTRDSEAMVCETSAWGRAIVAALAADTRKGIASAEEVRNRRAERDEPQPELDLQAQIVAAGAERGYAPVDLVNDFASRTNGKDPRQGTEDELRAYLTWLEKQPAREAVPA